jgi:hypothetical protein
MPAHSEKFRGGLACLLTCGDAGGTAPFHPKGNIQGAAIRRVAKAAFARNDALLVRGKAIEQTRAGAAFRAISSALPPSLIFAVAARVPLYRPSFKLVFLGRSLNKCAKPNGLLKLCGLRASMIGDV